MKRTLSLEVSATLDARTVRVPFDSLHQVSPWALWVRVGTK
jgi:hypothetical protein